MKAGDSPRYSVTDRLAAFATAMLFAVPTAFLVWLVANAHFVQVGGFLGSAWLWGAIVVFGVASLIAPSAFPSLLGAIWRFLYWLGKSI